MAKKDNQKLRTKRDARRRKKVNDSRDWEQRLLKSIKNGEDGEEEGGQAKRKRGKRETARRLTKNSL